MNSDHDDIIQNNYFTYRNISYQNYKNEKLPVWIHNELCSRRDARILDYGCGFGQVLQGLKGQGYTNIYGVDIENTAIESCISRGLDVRKINVSNLINPFYEKFDIIILSHVIEHIPKENIIETLYIIKKEFLNYAGTLLIAVPNAQSHTGCYWAYEDWTHQTLFTTGSVFYVLKAAGFGTIQFLDVDCTAGQPWLKKIIRKSLLKLYTLQQAFWNEVTCSSYHHPSVPVYSYEIKIKAF
ncbi:class I SAM-dependent methyltransferase [uncultured Desulfobacter sp.]|uniref:class I SAM-dependent methyltransferase n=1 Tax=uncultured Desulfobacter sp. TaxID=240139 RepID=UPI0029F4D1E3|nr:class I SAM-dependent methyltransferase [uncultured Desulfobacter sp.]